MSLYRPRRKDGTQASPFWHYDFQRGGRRFHGSTGTANRRDAEIVEARLRADAEREAENATISGAFGRFWIEKGQHDADADTTFGRLARLQDGLERALKLAGKPLTVAAITENELAIMIAARRVEKTPHGRKVAPATVNRETQLLRRVLRRARTVWKMPIDLPDWRQVLLDEPDEHVVDVPPALEAAILAHLRPDYRPALRFLVMSGLRAGNVLAAGERTGLRPDQVDFAAGVIEVRLKSRRPGGRLLRLPITGPMRVLLANEIGRHPEAVFTYAAGPARDGRRHGARYPLTYSSFYTAFKRAAAKAGHPRLRPHDLRHTAANRILAATGNMRLAQSQLGHTKITTTQRYTHPDLEALRAGLERAHAASSGQEAPETAAAATPKDERKQGA